jgi:hypothetical protein
MRPQQITLISDWTCHAETSGIFGDIEVSNSRRPPVTSGNGLPPIVTFTTGAPLLVQLGLVESITPDGLRYIARTRDDWPFGEGRKHPYIPVGNARAMDTKAFLAYFEAGPTSGGRGRKPE